MGLVVVRFLGEPPMSYEQRDSIAFGRSLQTHEERNYTTVRTHNYVLTNTTKTGCTYEIAKFQQ